MSDLTEVIKLASWHGRRANRGHFRDIDADVAFHVEAALKAPENRAALVSWLEAERVIEQPKRSSTFVTGKDVSPFLYRQDRPSMGDEVWATDWLNAEEWPTLCKIPLYRFVGEP